MTPQGKTESVATLPVRRIGLVAGLLAFALIVAAPLPEGLTGLAGPVAGLAVLMAIWWMTEALPLAATALAPLVVLPLFGLGSIEAVAASYAHPLIFLFLGGFFIARTIERWELHRSMALVLARLGGSGPGATIGAMMASTALLSMWISNTAAALVMVPIGQVVIARRRTELQAGDASDEGFAPALMLGIAFAATVGGMATLIGTPPNALFAAFVQSSYGLEIGFAQWMAIGLPISLVLLPVTWLILTRVVFRLPAVAPLQPQGRKAAPETRKPLSRPAKKAAFIIVLAALALVFRPALQGLLPAVPLSDAGIAIAAALLLFAIPAHWGERATLLTWNDAKHIRWDVLILFGGGLALASAIDKSGLAAWVGSGFSSLDTLPIALTILLAMAVTVYLGELASNTAMAAVFLPVAGAAAVGLGVAPMTLVLPVALAASLGFMLPVATPPNAIVYGSGEVSSGQMLRTGAILDVTAILIVYAIASMLGPIVIAA